MVAFPAILVKKGQEKAGACRAPQAPQMFYISNSWPWQSEEELQYPHNIQAPLPVVSQPSLNIATTKQQQQQRHELYSLSSSTHSQYSNACSSISSTSRSSSRLSRSTSQSHTTFSPPQTSFTSLWDDIDSEDEFGRDTCTSQLPPIHPRDYMKTLLSQLAACISSIKSAYSHQQTALISNNMLATDHGDKGLSAGMAIVISTADKAIVEELQSLSHLHSQLTLLPRSLTFKEDTGGAVDLKEEDSMSTTLQLKRYEGIIARFHDEIWRKKAVTEALKETLAKSMLKGEKLQQRVKVLEAKLTHSSNSIHDSLNLMRSTPVLLRGDK